MNLSRSELRDAIEAVARWPREFRRDLIAMQENERELFLLASVRLDASPVDEDGWPLGGRRWARRRTS